MDIKQLRINASDVTKSVCYALGVLAKMLNLSPEDIAKDLPLKATTISRIFDNKLIPSMYTYILLNDYLNTLAEDGRKDNQ